MNQSTPPFMFSLELKIEAILFFKNEPVSISELAKLTGEKSEAVKASLFKLREFYTDRGIVVIFDGEFVSFGTHPDVSELIERAEGIERSYSYKTTLKLLEHLGITRREDLPEYQMAFKKIEEFIKIVPTEQDG